MEVLLSFQYITFRELTRCLTDVLFIIDAKFSIDDRCCPVSIESPAAAEVPYGIKSSADPHAFEVVAEVHLVIDCCLSSSSGNLSKATTAIVDIVVLV